VRQPTLFNPACGVAGCPNLARTRKGGWCSAHYERHRRTGDVQAHVPVKQHRTGCAVPGCERGHYARALCQLHRDRLESTGSVRADEPLRPRFETRYDEAGRRYCHGCERFLDVNAFHGLSNRCIRCRQVAHFGMDAASWERLLASQGGRCAVCRTDEPGRTWHTDHDHECCPASRNTCGRCVRGILCSDCNTAIGLMRDDSDRLRAAASYLESHARRGPHEAPLADDSRPPEALA
jgi:hypothetical protein